MDRTRFEAVAEALGLDGSARERLWRAATTTQSTVGFTTERPSSETWHPDREVASHTEGNAGLAVAGRADRYQDLGPLGQGAMGEVRRIRDRDLNRVVAMKALLEKRRGNPRALGRFLAEAQATAQLQHPGIVPVHEVGVLDDGRPYYTMREVRGRSFREALVGLGSEGRAGLRRVVGLLRQAADAVGYAHSRGVVHRDLKPDNVMVGEHGEVLVVDWGLARIAGGITDSVELVEGTATGTRHGAVAGTPSYMAPEQARGQTDRIGPWTDVWALGAMLYEVLTGRPPYVGFSGDAVVKAIRRGPPPPISEFTASAPEDLVDIVDRALGRDPDERYADGARLARDLGRWLDGSLQRDRALREVARAREAEAEAEQLRREAARDREAAAQALEAVPSWASEEEKAAGWELLDRAEERDRGARLADDASEQALRSALTHAAALPEAHALLADRAREAWSRADALGDEAGRTTALHRLESHLDRLPEDHPSTRRHAAFVRGTGALTLVTEPPGARAVLHRFVRRRRRLVPEPVRVLGPTPLVEVPLDPGSWLVVLEAEGRAPVRYPVHIGRAELWDGVPPGADESLPVPLPTLAELGEDVYVPPGWFRSGGDPLADSSLPGRRLWCDGVVFERFPVTLADYLRFLDGLAEVEGPDAAARWFPRERSSSMESGAPLVAWMEGRHVPIADAEGETADPAAPVTMIDLACQQACARWRAARDGLPWRLPAELELEKARRGVDGRIWPWGDAFDPSWACVRDSHPEGRPMPVPVDRFPVDCSVYGVRGVAGNVLQGTCTVHLGGPPLDGVRVVQPDPGAPLSMAPDDAVTVMGGLFHGSGKHGRAAGRYVLEPTARIANYGMRLARSWPIIGVPADGG